MFDFRRLRSPIIQAPMAGGINTPELVAASINAGVVGSFAFAYSSPEQISKDIKAARSLIHSDAQGALNCNFFVVPENFEASAQDSEKALNALKSLEFAGNLELNLLVPLTFQIWNLNWSRFGRILRTSLLSISGFLIRPSSVRRVP